MSIPCISQKYSPAATIVITTKNRKDELREAVRSALAQTVSVEVLVIDDGSSDGTAEMVRQQFPTVHLHREVESRGLIVRRNQAARMAQGAILFSIDDDAAFASPRTVGQTLADFAYPRIGAVAIPYINVRQNDTVHQKSAPRDEVDITASYIGTAHAVRRDVFLQVGGYREHFVHQGEEGDFCLRMLAAGYVVRLGTADPIHHFESPRRDFRRMDYYGRRNDLLFCWHNVPMPELLAHLPATAVNGLRCAARVGRFQYMFCGIIAGFGQGIHHRVNRRPVDRRVYWLFRRLKKSGPLPLSQVDELLTTWIPKSRVPPCSVPNSET